MKQIAIVGAGSWGTALAVVAARAGHSVRLWSRNPAVVNSINERRVNSRYLSSVSIPDGVTAMGEINAVLENASMVLLAVPSHATRETLRAMSSQLSEGAIVVNVAKGIEIESGKRISEIAKEVVPGSHPFVSLSGPSFAKEVVEGYPTAIVAASKDSLAARAVQNDLSFENLRIYTNADVVGTELGGSVKNVMAIAAGMTAGLGFGANSVAALITRGLAEITRLARREGAQMETLMGLAGLGDLVLTCTGSLSRNRFVGEELGKGRTLEEITADLSEVAEGINTARAVKKLADRAGLEMPITNEVNAVLYDGKSARDAVAELMSRPLREENPR
ncbi:MAG TPA: NAD(P)H-dependent glycerol-3-phosphate dehydrogenase [Pyrinomonadaceae bacterium]|nr:NAD(P)H-dependent glycerol-3-phosphate dehydrogenase [Pyrinomonadaceae bacterium]